MARYGMDYGRERNRRSRDPGYDMQFGNWDQRSGIRGEMRGRGGYDRGW
jgi:hypothetical protein